MASILSSEIYGTHAATALGGVLAGQFSKRRSPYRNRP